MTLIELFQTQPIFFASCAGVLGLLVGSFLNVVIARLPGVLEHQWRQQCRELLATATATEPAPPGLLLPASRCPACGHRIRALENVPLISFIALRGRCSACGKPISRRYPLVEFLTGALSFAVAWHFGFSVLAAAGLLLTWALIALSFIDYDHQILPDAISLPVLWLGLVVNLGGVFADLKSAVIGAVAGYVSLWLIYQGFRLLTKKEGMGFGDFKLLALFGAWLGWQSLPLIVLLGSFTGAVAGVVSILAFGRARQQPIPFGPFLSIAGWIALLWGDAITGAYLRFSGLTP